MLNNILLYAIRRVRYAPIVGALFLAACVKTEIIPEVLTPTLSLDPGALSLTEGQKKQLTAQYTDDQGQTRNELIQWRSRNTVVATVSATGEIMASRSGQSWIVASVPNLAADSLLLTVVADQNAIARVEISAPNGAVAVGSTLQLTVQVFTANNQLLAPQPSVTWTSDPADLLSVSASGLVTGLRAGTATVTASAGGIKSVPFTIQVTSDSGNARQGTFSGNMGYSVSGMAALRPVGTGLVLTFGSDFRTSNGPGLGVYLAKNAAGALNSQNSVSLGTLQATSGIQEYSVPANVKITDFDYAVIYCVPFNVRFGTAMLEN
jgi:hypothetical protein